MNLLVKKVLIKVAIALTALISFHISNASYKAASFVNPRTDAWRLDVAWNPFANIWSMENEIWVKRSKESGRRLELVTFPSMRRVEASKRLSDLRQRILLAPFDVRLWEDLLSVQTDAGVSVKDRQWAMEVALTLKGWNNDFRLRVTAECLKYPVVLLESKSALCYRLLTNLPYKSNIMNASKLGMNPESLEQRLTELAAFYDLRSTLDSSQ